MDPVTTADDQRLAERRAAYARAVAPRGPDRDPRVEAAFAAVPREDFVGPPPWWVGSPEGMAGTGDPAMLYGDVLIALDRAKGINNGQPSLHAASLAALRLSKRDHALHVGTGTGYYTAILAELAGAVDGYEIEPALARRAAANLVPWPNARVHAESATARPPGHPLPPADAIYVSAGASAPDPAWLDALREGGRLLFPLTGGEGWGAMLRVERRGAGFAARFLMECGFIDCMGARDAGGAARLTAAFRGGGRERVRSLTRASAPGASTWFAGDGWSLSTEAPA